VWLRVFFEQFARCAQSTLNSSLTVVQVEVLGAVALQYRLACIVDCANDPFVVALSVARRAGCTAVDID
jgi:hypothetical protein